MLFTYPRDKYNEQELDLSLVSKLIERHSKNVSSVLENKQQYYLGKHHSKQRDKGPNNNTVSNHAKDITDTSTGYFMGNAIKYVNTADNDIEPLLVAFDNAEVDEVDHDNALDMSVYGCSYEYVYAMEGTNDLRVKNLEPENTFIVYDDSIEQKELFAIYYYERKNSETDKLEKRVVIFTQNLVYTAVVNSSGKIESLSEPQEHFMGELPVIEYQNNKHRVGDFEQQIPLIDAYNTLMSARVDDKEQFVDSILLLYGSQLASNSKEAEEAAEALRKHKLLELPADSKAEYLTHTLDESGTEVLRKAIKEDIYTFSHVPNLSDENFAGNSSGVKWLPSSKVISR